MRTAMKLLVLISALWTAAAFAASGSGEVGMSYLWLDEKGNPSVNQPTFNVYEGPAVSLRNFRYLFDNGLRINADLTNIILNNRNLNLGVDKPGLFGVRLNHNQYRRIYDYSGAAFTRRYQIGGSLWFYPQKYVKLFGGSTYQNRSGKTEAFTEAELGLPATEVDYNQKYYNAGMQINYRGRLLLGEYRTADFTDRLDGARDQKRWDLRLNGLLPVPRFEDRVILSGGFRHFETKRSESGFKISSNTGWGGGRLNLPENFSVSYNFVFDRASSDSDFVATDNVAHAVYLAHDWPQLAGLTVGYQHQINDDFEDEVSGNSYYASGWLRAIRSLELRAALGLRTDEVQEGTRLVGDQDRTRYRVSAKYSQISRRSLLVSFEGRIRKNDDLGSRIDFKRLSASGTLHLPKYAEFSGGYAYSLGKFENATQTFEFNDHLLYGDLTSQEYRGFTAGIGATYYRSRRDLDIEKSTLRFSGAYRFLTDYQFEVVYTVHNFDDLLDALDRYYTGNIVEFNLTRKVAF